jgi:uncharacterized protein (TIGR03086 family)
MNSVRPERHQCMTDSMLDLAPATTRLATIVSGISDDQLPDPTPCTESSVAALLDHVGGLSAAFTAAARKKPLSGAPRADAAHLPGDWRTRLPEQLAELAAAWRDPSAWHGATAAGGVELPGDVAGVVALDEVVLHGWDLARATGQAFDVEPQLLEAVHGFVARTARANPDGTPGLFGPPVTVAADAPLLDRVVGLAGRDPHWRPA